MRNIPRYGATRTFLDVYHSATGLILYSHALEGEDQFPWNALLTRDGRFTILVVNRRLTGDDQYEVLVYETLTAVHLYSLPDPFITSFFSVSLLTVRNGCSISTSSRLELHSFWTRCLARCSTG